MNNIVLVSICSVIMLVSILIFVWWQPSPKASTAKKSRIGGVGAAGSCSLGCQNNPEIDDVNNPAYNVQEVIENALLLEQHLAEKRKYCKECCVKHFLLIHGLLAEGIWMACKDCKRYPNLEESEAFFKSVFEKWRVNMESDDERLDALDKIRKWRQDMIRVYYFNGQH